MSPVEGLFIILSGAAAVELLELVSDGGVDDVDGGVELEDDGGALGLIDELDDVEPVLGGGVVDDEDDVEGDGFTTGGVLELVVFDSRWQPETPSAMPVHSNVTTAALLIVISKSVNEGNAIRFSRFGATDATNPALDRRGIPFIKQRRRQSTTRIARTSDGRFAHAETADFNQRR
jgi:hypothetical protein